MRRFYVHSRCEHSFAFRMLLLMVVLSSFLCMLYILSAFLAWTDHLRSITSSHPDFEASGEEAEVPVRRDEHGPACDASSEAEEKGRKQDDGLSGGRSTLYNLGTRRGDGLVDDCRMGSLPESWLGSYRT